MRSFARDFIFALTRILAVIGLACSGVLYEVSAAPNPRVTVSERGSSYILENGWVAAEISKGSGDLTSLKYTGLELLSGDSGHPFGYWSHSPGRGMRVVASVTIDPSGNEGDQAEVSVKGFYSDATSAANGTPGTGSACDIEIRYRLGRGSSGLYTYSIFTHPANYPATGIGEARFGVKLNPAVFDYLTINDRRRQLMPRSADWDHGTELNFKEARRLTSGIYKGKVEHKYDYSAIQFDIPAFGWSSTQHKIGLWFVNPSTEYLSGGATKVELTGHLDNNRGAAPTLLNYWRGSHYGGSICTIGKGEAWTKVIGPFLIYCNSGSDPDKMWKDALKQASTESRLWPYDWVRGVDYPHAEERATVAGQVIVTEPQLPDLEISNVLVGLAAPDYTPPHPDGLLGLPGNFQVTDGGEDESLTNANDGASAPIRSWRENSSRSSVRELGSLPQKVGWQNDAKFYQFWVRADARGRFAIPKVRPGIYTLHIIADGVLGEAVKTNVTVRPGETLDIGRLQWKPLRLGRQLWEIGIPNRSAEEFFHGDHYWQWGLYYQYPKDFPNDVNFVIGKSDYRRDWNYAQVPRSTSEGTVWSIQFNLTNALQGRATLRLGIAGISLREGIRVSINDKPVGSTAPLPDTATIRRDGIRGYWAERALSFDAGLLRGGTNVMRLSIPRGSAMSGVMYDYLRLELNDASRAGRSNPDS